MIATSGRFSQGDPTREAAVLAHRRFEAAARRAPAAPAAVWRGRAMSYGELDALAGRLARVLRRNGVGPDVRVALAMERGPELPVALLAVLKAGGAYVPVDPAYPAERIRYVVRDSGARLLLTHAPAAARVADAGIETLAVDLTDPALLGEDPWPLPDDPPPDALAYVIYTSGSTGRPKGVGVSHRSLGAHCGAVVDHYGLTPADRVAQITSIGFDISVEEIFPTWAAGGAVVMRPDDVPSHGAGFLDWLAREGVTALNLPTAFWHAWVHDMAASGHRPPALLRLVVVGGETAQPAALAEWRRLAPGVRWLNGYGPTEATVTATLHEPTAAGEGEVPIGRPLATSRAFILSPGLEPVPLGEAGELFLGGGGVARGYLGRPSLTAERFLPDPFGAEPGGRLYRTGDRARLRPDGEMEFLGRVDEQVKVAGFRVEPGEVQAVLAGHPAVAQAAVVAREFEGAGTRLVAYAVLRAGGGADAGALRRWLRERLPGWLVPSAVELLEALPLTPHGKVDRRALPAPAALDALPPGFAEPAGDTERAVAAAWAEVLGLPRVGGDDDFWELGGHSLLGMQVLARIRHRLGVELSVRALFDAPTVRALAAAVDAARGQPLRTPQPPLRPVPRTERLPLSFAQERLWFLHQMEPESPFYNIPFAVRLSGALDVDALRGALAAIVRRHEALRTTFHADAAGSWQSVHPAPAEFDLPVADLRALPPEWAPGEVLRLMADEAEHPFDLRRDAMLRGLLIRVTGREHVLVLNLHHAAGDGWSIGVLFRELAALYAAERTGAEPPLPEPAVQYADFAAWQRAWLRDDVLEAQLAYWRERLRGAPAVLELPTDRPRPAVQSHRGEVRAFEVPPHVTGRLRALARASDATLFMVLLAAFDLLVHRLSGRDDVVVGSPVAGRVRAETEALIGFFVNTMALRTDLSGDPAFRELVRRVRETTLEAYAHQDLPFERVVEAVRPERTLSHNPLFQVAFALQNVDMEPVELAGVSLRLEEVDSGTSKFDMFLEMDERGDRLLGRLEYATDLWEPGTVDRMIGLFLQLLEETAAHPDAPVSAAGTADEVERRTLVRRWGGRTSAYPRDSTIQAEFARVARARPDALALAWDGGAMSYGELDARSSRLANHLRRLGVGTDEPVALVAERGPELVVAVLGILKAGAAYVPVDSAYPRERMRMMLDDCGARVLLAQDRLLDGVPAEGLRVVRMEGDAEALAREPEVDPATDGGGAGAAYVLYTSGSTGRPKGVVVPHRAVLRLVRGTDYARFGPDEVMLGLAPAAFDASTLELWGPLLNGGRLALFPPGLPTMEALGGFIARHGVTTAWLTAGLFHQMVDANLGGLRGLTQLLAGGDVLSVPHVRRVLEAYPELRLVNGYGPTENTTFSTCHAIRAADAERPSIPIGRPVANTTAYVLDARHRPVPVDVPGQLHVGGDGLARGYLRAPGLTAARYLPDPFSRAPGARMYATGDRVRWRPDGTLEFLGRIDQQVKIRGHRIEPGEIESVVERHPEVADAVVHVREDVPGERRIVAYVVPAPAEGEAAPEEDAGLREGQVRRWEALFDDVYRETRGTEEGGAAFDIVGWLSSYTGGPIPPEEMREWADRTAERILELAPRRVLELGVGTGLLLFRVAPHARAYVGTDVSPRALKRLGERVRAAPGLPPVTLVQRQAADFAGLAPRGFDTVILNSVSQYFPGAGYLAEVVDGAVERLEEGGALFVGDVRRRATLEAFRAAVEFDAAEDDAPLRELLWRARRLADEEEELVVDPGFFLALAERNPRIGRVDVRVKRGRHHNELTRHRYDVVLRAGPAAPRPPAPTLAWDGDALTVDAVRQALLAAPRGPLAVLDVPDARIARELRIAALAAQPDGPATVGDARRLLEADPPVAVDPEEMWELAEALGLAAEVRVAGAGRFDVLFRAPGAPEHDFPPRAFPPRPLESYTNRPLRAAEARGLAARVRGWLAEQLPEYMLPAAVVVMDAFPLTANGKVDRRALPAPDLRPGDAPAPAAPRTDAERELAALWAEVLRLERVYAGDNFFDLGGHSLLATQLVTRVREHFQVDLPLQRVFEAPTLEAMARVVETARVDAMAALLDGLDDLSDDEVRALLEAEQSAFHDVAGG